MSASAAAPGAASVSDLDGAAGVLWHVAFFMRDRGVRDPAALWHETSLAAARPLVVHMLAEDASHIEFTFSAVDDGVRVADAIGNAFDAVLYSSERRNFGPDLDTARDSAAWRSRARRADYRVLAGTGWNIGNDDTVPITNFGAGGGVQAVPCWP